METGLVSGHSWWRRECRNKRVYGPSIEDWWTCTGHDAYECLGRLRMYVEQAAEEICRHHGCYIRHRRRTHAQVQMLRTQYLHFMTPRTNNDIMHSVGAECQPKWTRTMEVLANSIRQRAQRHCQIDKDLLKYLEHLLHSKCLNNHSDSNFEEEMDPLMRRRIWKRRWASHRTPVLEGTPHDQQMLMLPRRYPGIVPETRLVPRLPMAMVQAANGDLNRLGWTGSNGMIDPSYPSNPMMSMNNPSITNNPSMMMNNQLNNNPIMMNNHPSMPVNPTFNPMLSNNQIMPNNNAMHIMNNQLMAPPAQTLSNTNFPQAIPQLPMNTQNPMIHPQVQLNNPSPIMHQMNGPSQMMSQPLNFNPSFIPQQQPQYQMQQRLSQFSQPQQQVAQQYPMIHR